ncbi:MAG: malonate transporter subunit MadL [Pseudomonadales bacterium]|nr:malonate transporter subunit MadL [Pseudomonadales bacterium]
MIIYGVALLSACLLAGQFAGELLGQWLGVQANVGGVGIAMLLLMLACQSERCNALIAGPAGRGIHFWSAMYIPIVVAMAATQNVAAAVDGGLLAILAAVLAVIAGFALVPLLSRIGKPGEALPPASDHDAS